MRDTRPRPDSARTVLRDVLLPDDAAVRDAVRAARELSATVARLLSAASPA